MADYILAIDQGTTSSRAIVFDHSGSIVSTGQKEHEQIFPKPGWVEHDPMEIWDNIREVVGLALTRANLTYHDIAAVGITNQRETAVVWDRTTGQPVYNAIVWQDTRTNKICDELAALGGGADRYKANVGLPLATYFSGPKVRWILDNVDGAREKAEAGQLAFGNTDAWVLWNMTGGVDGGVHVTDVTNASRTMLMDLATLSWDADIAAEMGIPMSMLPEIKSSSEVYGHGPRGRHGPGRADRRHPRRPAGGDVRPGVLRAGHGEEHLRHRQLHAAQHRHRAGAVEERPADDGLLQDRRQAGRCTRSRARSP